MVAILIYSALCSLSAVLCFARGERRSGVRRNRLNVCIIAWGALFPFAVWIGSLGGSAIGYRLGLVPPLFYLAGSAVTLGVPGLLTVGLVALRTRAIAAPAAVLLGTCIAVASSLVGDNPGRLMLAFFSAPILVWWPVPLITRGGLLAGRRRVIHGHCRSCGYNLQGLPHAVCPECGMAAGA
jgi:hypothetical protein